METFKSDQGRSIVLDLVKTIQDNAAYLSEIDGAIGDGDHGINMKKGFTLAGERLGEQADLSGGLRVVGDTLLTEIGGAMGPLYGTLFLEMAETCQGKTEIDAQTFGKMLDAGVSAVQDLGGAKVGDKTLMDTLVPAHDAYAAALANGEGFAGALQKMAVAAEKGKESTRDLVAKIGRASRLGERSRGHLDAGSTSCYLILQSLADSMA
ncbi:MAG: dihydroxyacetone kinase subunit L, partial [Anaerolineae bacterium]|nr:dihydroxyacetone kinase subunit L [Anaerolineae bacterium]